MGEADQLTIDQLAQRTGMSARNIRAHQSRGLLDPPQLRGRTGYYTHDHVARIELIQELQHDGYSLELIGRLLQAAGGSTRETLRLTAALHQPFGSEQPRVVELAEIQRRFRSRNPGVLAQAEEVGILRRREDGRYEEVTPHALRGAEAMAELGVPAEDLMVAAGELRRHTDAIAAAFVRLFVERVWWPFEEAGSPEDGLSRVVDALERLRPLAPTVVASFFQISMGEATARSGAELERLRHRRERARP